MFEIGDMVVHPTHGAGRVVALDESEVAGADKQYYKIQPLVPDDRRATAFGFLSGAALFGGAVSPSVAGLLAPWDLRGIFFLDAPLFAGLALGQLVAWRSDRAAAVSASRAAPG